MSVELDARHLVVDGVRSPVRIGGPDTEPVVFVHGNNPGADWGPLAEPVARFARVVVPDLPGFGGADKPADWGYTVADYVAHLHGALQQLGIGRVHLVAHDFGGPFALAWAAEHLDSVGSITLVNTPVRIDHLMARIWQTPVLGELFSRVASVSLGRWVIGRQNPDLPAATVEQLVHQGLVPGTRRAVVKLYRSTGIDAIGAYTERLKGFTGNALVVFGDADAFIGVEQADEQRRVFANSRLEIVPGAGHWPWLERPELVIPLVTGFPREQLSAT